MRELNFYPTKAEDDIWIQKNGEHYKYIASYVDDLCIVARDPNEIINNIKSTQNFKFKGSGPIKYHLGCDYFTGNDGCLASVPIK